MASQGSDPTPEFPRPADRQAAVGSAPSPATTVDLDDLDLACGVMHDATNLAVAARRDLPPDAIVDKSDGSVVTAVDVALQVYILTRLEEVFGSVPTIAEEDMGSIRCKPAAEA